jgi:exodeoxyribonuclease V alpha subunit
MFALDDSQKKALKMACDLSQKLTLITGHAGCGKTQTAKIIIENIGDCELACPTGKGAARLAELTGKDASTIHRMLNFDGVIWRRKNYFKTPLIIDEASMISASLMAKNAGNLSMI